MQEKEKILLNCCMWNEVTKARRFEDEEAQARRLRQRVRSTSETLAPEWVYDALGNTVLINDAIELGNEYVLSLFSIPQGLYTIHLESEAEKFTKRFVK